MSVCGGKDSVGIFNLIGIGVLGSISSVSLFSWKFFHCTLLMCSVRNLNSFFSISSVHCGVGTKFSPWFRSISWLSVIFRFDLFKTFSLAVSVRFLFFLYFSLDLYLFLSYLFLFFNLCCFGYGSFFF